MNSEQRLIIAILRNADGEEVLRLCSMQVSRHTDCIYRWLYAARKRHYADRGRKERVEIAVQLIREHSAPAIDPGLKRATIFVLKVDQFEQI